MRTKLIVSSIILAITYFVDHRIYLVVINVLVPLVLIKDLVENRDVIRILLNNGEPVRYVKMDLSGIEIDGKRVIGLKVLSTPITASQSFEEALARGRALINLLAQHRAFIVLTPRDYIIGIDEKAWGSIMPELTRLGIVVRRISGFELANAMRMRVTSRSFARPFIILLLVPPLILISAYVLAAVPLFYLAYSIADYAGKRFVVKMGLNHEVVSDMRATRLVDNSTVRMETLSTAGRIRRANAHVVLTLWVNNDVPERIKNRASNAYGKFLMLRHVKYFIRYKDFENTVRRIQRGEGAYSIYLASTIDFDASFKWRWVPSPSISKVLAIGNTKAWSMELDLVAFTPFFLNISDDGGGLAIIGEDIDGNDVYWPFHGSSPHMLIIGPTGSGKTTLAMSIVYQVKRRLGDRVRVVIIDPHGHARMLSRLIRIRDVDLGEVKVVSRDLDVTIEAIRMMSPLLSLGPEGALLRMALLRGNYVNSIGDIVKYLEDLASDPILREAYYNLYNSLAILINYYDHGNTINVDDLLNDDVIFVMSNVVHEELNRYLTTLILLTVFKRAAASCKVPPCPLRYIILIDEAHSVIGLPSELRALGVEGVLTRLVREVRKFGVALIVLLQPPLDVLDPGVLENMGVIIALSGGYQYVSHLSTMISGISNDDVDWLLSGRYRALVIRQGVRPIHLARLYVVREFLGNY